LGGTWPPGFAIDGNGVITGEALIEATYPGLTVIADNIYAAPVSSNTFTGTAEIALTGFLMTIRTTGPTENFTVLGSSAAGTYNGTIDYGDGSATKHFSAWDDPDFTHEYAVADDYQIKITGIFPAIQYNNVGDKDSVISVENWGDVGWTISNGAFRGCLNLTEVTAIDGQFLSGSNTFDGMFRDCSSLTQVEATAWDTGSVINMGNMFNGCGLLTSVDVSGWDTALVTTTSNMFLGCSSLLSLDTDNWNTALVDTMLGMFNGCTSITSIGVANWDVGEVTDMLSMFFQCGDLVTLDVSGWLPAKLILATNMFRDCGSLVTLDVSGWTVGALVNAGSMFRSCTLLSDLAIDGWDISSVTDGNQFLLAVTLPTARYDAVLIAWDGIIVNTGTTWVMGGSKYTPGGAAEAARDNWTDVHLIVLTDGGAV
jgi:surface protein